MPNVNQSALLVPSFNFQKQHSDPSTIRNVSILGSTGSIGTSALEVIKNNPGRFNAYALLAHKNISLLKDQCLAFRPKIIGVSDLTAATHMRSFAREHSIELVEGSDAIEKLSKLEEVDVVLAAIVGSAGLLGVISALKSSKIVALANKESLIVGASFVAQALQTPGSMLVPVDSEHSAIFQALHSSSLRELRSITLTASGGPFLRLPIETLRSVTPEAAIKHPRWNMGQKISIDSATMMNKALEMIEAAWLFGLTEAQIQVVIHPQSIVHSAIHLNDGSIVAQLSYPDMKGPISYALGYPYERCNNVMSHTELSEFSRLDFTELDLNRFPAVRLARQCLREGGAASMVLNYANEAAVAAFLDRKIAFTSIVECCEEMLSRSSGMEVTTLDSLFELEREVRIKTAEYLALL